MLERSRETAAAGGRGAQATHRGPIGGRARPAAHHDRAGGRPGQCADPCAHPVEGQPGRGRPWLDRRRHWGRAGGQPRHCGPGPHAVRRGGAGRRGVPQAARAPVPPQVGRGAGGAAGRADLQRATAGPQALDVAAAGRSAGRLGGSGVGVVGDSAAGLEATRLKPWLTGALVHPARAGRRVLLADGDVLGVSTRPDDPLRPQVCLDETSRQLLGEVSPPRPVAPGRPARQDYEYQRGACATCSWSASRLPAGARSWSATGAPASTGRTPIKDLLDVCYPDAEQIVLVQDNLEHHTPASLYEAFPQAEARRLADRLELHYTPKHGSWLNMAEIELAMLAGQCLDRRLADRATLEREVAAWQT